MNGEAQFKPRARFRSAGGSNYAVALVPLASSGFAAMGYQVLFARVIALVVFRCSKKAKGARHE